MFRRRSHEQFSVNNLIPVPGVGKQLKHIGGPFSVRKRHTNIVRWSRRWRQAAYDVRTFHESRRDRVVVVEVSTIDVAFEPAVMM